MSMMQLVLASALGFIAAQGGLYGMRSFAGWLQRGEVRTRIGRLVPSSAHGFVGGFVRYAAPVGASAAVITLGVWAVSDYISAHSAHGPLAASSFDSVAAVAADAASSSEDAGGSAAVPSADLPVAAAAASDLDPYADPDYKVQHRSHHGATASLEDTLLQRSEAKARAELLKGIQLHVTRSQYDCEAIDRANRYLKAGLDVWGFATWQAKYFPTGNYRGATLSQCRDIKSVIDPAALDLQSTVAQQKRH